MAGTVFAALFVQLLRMYWACVARFHFSIVDIVAITFAISQQPLAELLLLFLNGVHFNELKNFKIMVFVMHIRYFVYFYFITIFTFFAQVENQQSSATKATETTIKMPATTTNPCERAFYLASAQSMYNLHRWH